MKRKTCPKCETINLGDRWVAGRKLQQYCRECLWKGEPRIPELIKKIDTKEIMVNYFDGFNYEIFDKYGHNLLSSKYYSTKTEAIASLKKQLKLCNSDPLVSPCTGIFWPNVITVKGEIYK